MGEYTLTLNIHISPGVNPSGALSQDQEKEIIHEVSGFLSEYGLHVLNSNLKQTGGNYVSGILL